ncbi:MAG: hypothetical protein J0653_07115, partial [Deltaproteobacteria bacterium]|nr:hypothetical protein [Deltaproteobacteria bacterium]
MTKCSWQDVHQLKYLMMGTVKEIEVRFNSLTDDWAKDYIANRSTSWLQDKDGIILLGNGVYGIHESVGFHVSPNAILLATLDHYIAGYSTLYISRKIGPKLFPSHVLATLVGTDTESLSWGKLNDDEWKRLSAVIGKLVMATFHFANWHTITLSELDEIIFSMRAQDNLK